MQGVWCEIRGSDKERGMMGKKIKEVRVYPDKTVVIHEDGTVNVITGAKK